MNKSLVIFAIASLLSVGAILVYAKNSSNTLNRNENNQNTLGIKTSPTPTPIPTLEIKELKIEDIKVGTGSGVKSGDFVSVNYIGTLPDGEKFDSSYDRSKEFSFKVGEEDVIEGWDLGILNMKVGGKRKLFIPSGLAYGAAGVAGIIPPNSPLIFEIELVSIK